MRARLMAVAGFLAGLFVAAMLAPGMVTVDEGDDTGMFV
jgi:hypothetical protein